MKEKHQKSIMKSLNQNLCYCKRINKAINELTEIEKYSTNTNKELLKRRVMIGFRYGIKYRPKITVLGLLFRIDEDVLFLERDPLIMSSKPYFSDKIDLDYFESMILPVGLYLQHCHSLTAKFENNRLEVKSLLLPQFCTLENFERFSYQLLKDQKENMYEDLSKISTAVKILPAPNSQIL